jgi:hypothetical protein
MLYQKWNGKNPVWNTPRFWKFTVNNNNMLRKSYLEQRTNRIFRTLIQF